MEQHNRKSYLAPPAPRAIKRDGSRDSTAYSPVEYPLDQPTQPSSHNNQQQQSYPTPTSGEIPMNFSREPGPRNNAGSLGFENLSLDKSQNQDYSPHQHHSASTASSPFGNGNSASRAASRSQYSSASNISSPQYGTRSASSPYYSSRGANQDGINGGGNRTAPPTGPLPHPPRSTGNGGWGRG